MSQGCGLLTKRNPKDDVIPCGTKLWFVVDKRTVREDTMLCPKCNLKVAEASEL
jgi:hypothetical protein